MKGRSLRSCLWEGNNVPKKIDILGVKVDPVTMDEAVAQVETYMDEMSGVLVATANAEMIMRATHDHELMKILNDAALVVPDGAGTVWAAHHLGHEMPERVAGYDLAQELMRRAPEKKRRIFFFGSAPGVAELAKKKAERLYPGIEIVGTRNGFFSKKDEPAIIEEIRKAQPDLLPVPRGMRCAVAALGLLAPPVGRRRAVHPHAVLLLLLPQSAPPYRAGPLCRALTG